MNMIVKTEELDFSYGSVKILHSLNLNVPRGSIYCFLGPNGAGKTTTLRILLGLIKAKGQRISIFNKDLNSNRISILKKIGSLIKQPSLYGHLSGKDNLEVFRLSYGVLKDRINAVLEITGLSHAKNQLVRTYSLGMKQRLAIALALLPDPELLILDEPTNGLDPQGIVEARELMRRLNLEFNKTILISSHLLSEVEKVATHFAIIHKGHMLFQGTESELRLFKSRDEKFEVEVADAQKAVNVLSDKYMIERTDASVLHFSSLRKEQVPDLLALLVREEIRIYQAAFSKSNLEDVFMKIIAS